MWRGLTFLLPFLFFGHVSHTRMSSSTPWVSASGSQPHWTLHLLNRLPPLQFWQLFNALTLFNLARDPECKEWQVSQEAGRDAWESPLDLACPDLGLPYPRRCSCAASPSSSSSSAISSPPSEWCIRSSTASSTGARRIKLNLMPAPKGLLTCVPGGAAGWGTPHV